MTTSKNNQLNVNKTVIVISFPDGNFLNGWGTDQMTIDYSENIKYADWFSSIEEAKTVLSLFNKNQHRIGMKGKVYKINFNIDSKFLLRAEDIIELPID